jgi:two-component system response regulator VicR
MSMKILLCDNNLSVLKLLERILRNAGHEVLLAQDGLKARKIIQEYNLDFFVTEIQIPFISGLELISFAKKKDHKISTMILSQVNAEGYIHQAFKIGADDYITKPFNPDMMLTRIKKVLINKA